MSVAVPLTVHDERCVSAGGWFACEYPERPPTIATAFDGIPGFAVRYHEHGGE